LWLAWFNFSDIFQLSPTRTKEMERLREIASARGNDDSERDNA
jgi:hypothetical protein